MSADDVVDANEGYEETDDHDLVPVLPLKLELVLELELELDSSSELSPSSTPCSNKPNPKSLLTPRNR